MSSAKAQSSEVARTTSEALTRVVNEASVGLYRVQEHVLRTTSSLVAARTAIVEMKVPMESALSDVREAQDAVSRMNRVAGFHNATENLKSLLN
ncbi:hypothetical protein HK100_000470 [Physocladia obscura]|uniref:Uncharacterized protein n=1 Tax=Physocladia obscura TaxID=109957 RepID=A0AAD5XCH9_9FUNG|nr:hypothetical protein HK100_000470 [Physocladia obscura]